MKNTFLNTSPEIHGNPEPQSNTDIELLTAKEFLLTLKIAGFSHREFAEYIDRSKSLVGAMCRGERTIDLRFQVALKNFLGHKLYAEALRHARTAVETQERLHTEEMLEHENRRAELIRQQEEHELTIREQRLVLLQKKGNEGEK